MVISHTESDIRRAKADAAGLCDRCRHHAVQASARGGHFHRCARADVDERFERYPRTPVMACGGFEPSEDRDVEGTAIGAPLGKAKSS